LTALGRLTGVSFSDGSPTETVGYDANTNGMGRLTAFTDSAGGTEFSYNSLGQLIQETRTNSGMASLATVYGYNSANDDLDSITYPSGLVVSYGRDSNGRINAILADSAPLIGSISYMPFGPAEDYDMIAGGAVMLHVDRTFNERYLPTRIQAGTVMDYQYKYYADGSVWQISGVPTTTVNQEVTDSYQVSGTNQLDYSVTDTNPPVQYGYDYNGNTISDGSRTFTYDRHNRLISISQGTETLAEYAYDIQGRRVKKTAGGLTTCYVYDLNSNLIAETNGDGTPLKDYIYLGSEPVAMKVYGAQAGIYYFINDHLGTPQKIVDSNGAMVWEAAYLPFGQAQVLVATITNNLRFPGQYFNAETGLHYNWHRYYDPTTGRYLSADPIGLDGGMNLYAYVGGDPINWIDPWGLEGWLYGYNSWGMPLHPSSSVMWDKLSEEEKCKEQGEWLKEPPADEFFENLMMGGTSSITKSSLNRLKNLVKRLSRIENVGLSQNKLDQLGRVGERAGAKVRVDIDGVKGTGVRPHAHLEGLGKKVESRHIWLQDGVK